MAHGNTFTKQGFELYIVICTFIEYNNAALLLDNKKKQKKHQSVLFCSVLLFSIYTLQKSLLIKLERIYLWLFNLKVIMSKHSKADR